MSGYGPCVVSVLLDFIVKHRDNLPTGVPIVVCCKGIENGSLLTPFEILEEELPGKVIT